MPECGESYLHSYPTSPSLSSLTHSFGPAPAKARDSLQHLGQSAATQGARSREIGIKRKENKNKINVLGSLAHFDYTVAKVLGRSW